MQNFIKNNRGFAVLIACQQRSIACVEEVADFYARLRDRPELDGLQSRVVRVYTGNSSAIEAKVRKDLAELAIRGDIDYAVVAGLDKPIKTNMLFAEKMGITVLEGDLSPPR